MKKFLFSLGLISLLGTTASAAWTDPTLTAGNPIKAVHITEIRDATKWDTNSTATGNISYNGGNVGIGTTGPASLLHLNKGSLGNGLTNFLTLQGARGDFGATPAGVGILFKDQDTNNNTNEAEIKMMTVNATTYGDNDEAASNLIFNTTNGGVKSDKMIITGRGDVGIGTLNPGKTLDVNGSIRAASAGSSSWATISAPNMAVDNSFYSYNTICAGNASGSCTSSSGVVLKASGSNVYGNTFISGNGNSYFNTGNLGIGTTSPSYKLDVSGTGRFTGTVIGATPTASNHLTTKAYVDGAVGGDNLGAGGTTSGVLYSSNGSGYGYIGQGSNNYARWDSSGTTYYNKAGTWRMYMHAGGFSPYTNNTMTLGGIGNRWNNLYATTGNYYAGGVNIDGEGGWAGFRMDGNAATKNLWMHYGGDTSNELRFARIADNYGVWEANVVRFDLDAPADSLRLQESGNVSMPQGATLGGTTTFNGKLYMDRNTTNQIESANNTSQLEIQQSSATGDAYLTFHNAGSYAVNFGLDRTTNDLAVGGWSMGATRYRVWHSGNDGTGSGLDADLMDGLSSSAGATASTIAQRDSAGDVHARLFRSSYGEQSSAPAATADIAFRNDTSDNYIRFMTRDAARSYLGVSDPDNLGNHVASATLNMGGNAITSSAGTIRDGNGGWIRTYGSTGWYNGTYGGGWNMTDSTWIRAYGNKSVITAGTMQAGSFVTAGSVQAASGVFSGSVQASSFVYNSDRELKENIRPLEDDGKAILGLGTYRFDWKDGRQDYDFGVIAQEVEAIYPEIVSLGGEGYKTVDYAKLVVPLLEVTKSQEARIEALEAKLEALTK